MEAQETYAYENEWKAYKARMQREYELSITLNRWGDLLSITKDIEQESKSPTTNSTKPTQSSALSTSANTAANQQGKI